MFSYPNGIYLQTYCSIFSTVRVIIQPGDDFVSVCADSGFKWSGTWHICNASESLTFMQWPQSVHDALTLPRFRGADLIYWALPLFALVHVGVFGLVTGIRGFYRARGLILTKLDPCIASLLLSSAEISSLKAAKVCRSWNVLDFCMRPSHELVALTYS